MSYLVFARKFRPQRFEEVAGQQAIVTTLSNAIGQGRLPQSFLFSGPRGTGKTSTARILAKALNCAKGPTPKPCQECVACKEITQGNSLDVLEVDGASNRGIDEIRNLRETVKFKPVSGRFKVYIIDEVHMLTTEAFNALLKTLEEPPPHVKFIFATTELHKVPLTILSRCQRFPFKRIPTAVITAKLEEIAKAEKLKCEKQALFLIAKASEGSLRDAESLLDQLASFAEEKIREEDVLSALGLAAESVYGEVLEALHGKDAAKIFSIVTELYESGRDLAQFAKGLLEWMRHLLLLRCGEKTAEFIELSAEGLEELKKRKNQFSHGELLLALSLLGNLQSQLRRNLAPPKLLIETALLKLLHLEGLKPVESFEETPVPAKLILKPPAPSSKPEPRLPASAPPSPRALPSFGEASPPSRSGEKPPEKPEPEGSSWALAEVESIWSRVVDYVKTKRMSLGIFLSESTPVELVGSRVTLGLAPEFQFHKEMLEKESHRKIIEEAFEAVGGKRIGLDFVITEPEKQEKPVAEAADASGLPEIITQAMNIFEGARIIKKE